MLLTLDISNTSIKAGVFRGDELLANWRLATERQKLTDDYAMLLLGLLQASGLSASEIDGVSLSCVVPPLRSVFDELARKYLHLTPLIVGPGIKTGVNWPSIIRARSAPIGSSTHSPPTGYTAARRLRSRSERQPYSIASRCRASISAARSRPVS